MGLGGPGHPRARARRVQSQYREASTFLAYGGWWEDKTGIRNDNDFNNNGLVSADRTPHPGLYAIKYVYRYLHAAPVDLAAGKIKVKNWFDFINPKDLAQGTWEVKADGQDHRLRQAAGTRYRAARGEGIHARPAEDRRRSRASSTGST